MGVNDVVRVLNGEYDFGDVTDIDLENYNNNKDTFVGHYAKIIQRYKEIQPDAFFFLMTMPMGGNCNDKIQAYHDMHRELMYKLSEIFTNTFVLDFRKYAPVYDDEFRKNFYLEGHMTPTGYLLTGKMVASYIDYIIRKNNEYEEMRIYNSPAEVKLRKMIEEATRLAKLDNEKYQMQKAKLEEKRKQREMMKSLESQMGL